MSPKAITSVVTEYKDKAYKLRKDILKSQYKEAVENLYVLNFLFI